MKGSAALLGLLLLAVLAAAGLSVFKQASAKTESAQAAQRGSLLFRNKGCVTCHLNQRVEGQSGVLGRIGPNLTNYQNDPQFLRRWLADPAAVRPGTQMPDPHLSAADIEDLIAFLNQPR